MSETLIMPTGISGTYYAMTKAVPDDIHVYVVFMS